MFPAGKSFQIQESAEVITSRDPVKAALRVVRRAFPDWHGAAFPSHLTCSFVID
jgi:hypothetical protein